MCMYQCVDVAHLMFDCIPLEGTRTALWQNVLDACPSDVLRVEIHSMGNTKRAEFVISCICNSYVTEWDTLYRAICTFVFNMYCTPKSITSS